MSEAQAWAQACTDSGCKARCHVGSVRHWPVTPRRLQDIAYTAIGGVPWVDVRCGNMIVSASVEFFQIAGAAQPGVE